VVAVDAREAPLDRVQFLVGQRLSVDSPDRHEPASFLLEIGVQENDPI